MKMFYCQCDEIAVGYFKAETASKARQKALMDARTYIEGDADYRDIRVLRCPELDDYPADIRIVGGHTTPEARMLCERKLATSMDINEVTYYAHPQE